MRRAVFAVVVTVAGLVLLLSYKTRATTGVGARPAAIAPANGATSTGSSGSAGSTGTAGSRTVTGDEVDTRYGPVQVRITLVAGKLTDVTAVELPDERPRDVEISNFSVPTLRQEAITAQSANIDLVSGATYTSEGYIRSLQSALDKAKS